MDDDVVTFRETSKSNKVFAFDSMSPIVYPWKKIDRNAKRWKNNFGFASSFPSSWMDAVMSFRSFFEISKNHSNWNRSQRCRYFSVQNIYISSLVWAKMFILSHVIRSLMTHSYRAFGNHCAIHLNLLSHFQSIIPIGIQWLDKAYFAHWNVSVPESKSFRRWKRLHFDQKESDRGWSSTEFALNSKFEKEMKALEWFC